MGPDLTPADTAEATAEAIADRGKHLGLTWGLRLATVAAAGTDPQNVLATYDGDDTPIGMTSMVGTLPSGARVYVMEVPPGGNFIVADTGSPAGFLGANTTNNGTVATGTGTEQAIPSANWDNEPTFVFPPGRMFEVNVVGGAFNSLGTAQAANIRVREGAQTIVGTVLGTWEHVSPAGYLGAAISFTYITYIKNSRTSVVSTKLSLTIQRILGAGSYSLYGDATVPLSVAVKDIGLIARHPELADIAVSV